MKRLFLLAAASCALTLSSTFAAGPLLISEFMASNTRTLADADGEFSDWIEILNPGTNTVDLAGWHLTDDPAVLAKWTFPSTDLAPGGFLVVFASGKNRAVAGAELHANFQLEKTGDYLALVEPDGFTIAHQFVPNFPPQVDDLSYGVETRVSTTLFVAGGAQARWTVPASAAALPTNWTAPEFDHRAWSLGPTGLGFSSGATHGLPAGTATNLARGRPASQSSTLGGYTADVAVNGNPADFTHTQAGLNLPSSWEVNLGTNYALERIVVYSRADCCGSRLRDITVRILTLDGTRTNFTSVLLNPENAGYAYPNGPTNLTLDLTNLVGGPVVGGLVRVTRTPDPDLSGTAGQGNSDEADVLALAEVEVFGGPADVLGSLVRTDLAGAMRGANASVLVRIPFGIPVEEMPVLDRLTLRMKYDDGFVASLNGVEIARRNAPATLAWDSAATVEHPLGEALQFEEIDVTPFLGLLREGENVLAIQGLNLSATDDDFLVLPELAGTALQVLSESYLSPATPGGPNSTAYLGLVADPQFSAHRGLFTAPFSVTLTTTTPGAEIRYTTNGSPPGVGAGLVYSGPIPISRTTVLRAVATKPGHLPSAVDTQTYVFLTDVVGQSAASALSAGFPGAWAGYPGADYAMDPRITTTNAGLMEASLRSLPSVFVTTTISNLFDDTTGIYSHPTSGGVAWERPASLEMINTNGASEFQVNCGLRVQGGYFRQAGVTHKHSLRVLFRQEYGTGRLHHDLFPGTDAVQEFDSLVFRAGANDGYAWPDAKDTEQFIRDQFGRTLQLDTGHPAPHGRFVHLYLNGLYWGLYNLVERPNEDFSASYFGGSPEEWDANNAGDIKNGDLQAWNTLLGLVTPPASLTNYQRMQGLDLDGSGNPAYPVYLDALNYIDYMIVNMWGGNWDWPNKNFWIGRRRTPESTGFKFYTWDYENTMGNNMGRSPVGMVAPRADIENTWVGQPHYALKTLVEYKMNFADRVQRFFFNGGLLSPAVLTNRYRALADSVQAAILSETARWGDDNLDPPQDLSDWLRARDWVLGTYLPARSAVVLQQFLSAGLYPAVSAPGFNQFGGAISNGFALTLYNSNAAGTIYYTLDGTDPRVVGGAVSGQALAYSNAIPLTTGTRVKARILNGTNWSALNQADFILPDLASLRVTELMYHPAAVTAAEQTAGFTNVDDFEFIELRNVGPTALNLAGLAFDKGITFTFTGGSLAAGEHLVLVKNPAAFTLRYGTAVRLGGTYSGNLNNGGERLRLLDTAGRSVQDFTYSDGWYPTTDGFGFSLVILDDTAPGSLWDLKTSWGPSSALGGSPGLVNPPPPVFPWVVINEVLPRPVPPNKAAVELANLGAAPADLGGWWLTDDFRAPRKFQLPPGTIIPVGGFLVLTEDDFNAPALGTNAFNLSPAGGELRLFSAGADGTLTGYYQGWDFGAADEGMSFGRHVTSTGADQFVAQLRTTLGAANAGPRVGPLVVSEIMYHPPDLGVEDNTRDEFLEVFNLTASPVPLFDPSFPDSTWQLKGGLDFSFPTNLTLGAGAYLLVVNFDPHLDPAMLTDFRARYSVPSNVIVLGPYTGRLNNDQDDIELKRPTRFATGLTGFVQVDKVSYHDAAPWPLAADGMGASLHRLAPDQFGNDPANWLAAAPTAAGGPGTGVPPRVISQPLAARGVLGSNVAFSVSATGSEPLRYQWLLDGHLLAGATNAALAITAVRADQAGSYSVMVFNAAGSLLSEAAPLSLLPPVAITSQPQTFKVNPGTNVAFSVGAVGTGLLTYQWRFNGLPLLSATNPTLALSNVQLPNDGLYDVLVTDEVSAVLSQAGALILLVRPSFVDPITPSNVVAAVGETVTFRINAAGRLPISYRWRKTGASVTNMILNDTNCLFTITNLQLSSAGAYDVALTNIAGPGVPPLSGRAYLTVVVPPTNQAAAAGGTLTLRATLKSPTGFTNRFWWLLNSTNELLTGTNIATTSVSQFANDLVLSNLSAAQVGRHTFLVSNTVVLTNLLVTADPPATNYVRVTNVFGAPAAFTALVQLGELDSDGDGLPDAWTQQYFGHPLAQAGDRSRATDDADGDGLRNGQEFLAGTDPTNALSVLKVDSLSVDHGAVLRFGAVSNRTYTVQYCDQLAPAAWHPLTNVPARATHRTEIILDPAPAPNRFYRVVTPLQP